MQKIGITNLTTLTVALGGTGTLIGKIVEDGSVDWTDLWHLRSGLKTLKKFAQVDYQRIWPEAKDIDPSEAEDLAEVFKEAFELPSHLSGTEEIVESGLQYLLDLVDAVLAFTEGKNGVKIKKSA